MTGTMAVAGQLPPPELELELEEPVGPYEQYRGVPTLIDGKRDAAQEMGPVSVANTNVPALP
jgi:hypothetical protein